ncbi:hypothetical protein ACFSSC_07150 [Corynebacterium mendelii]|uniref:EcsC family protein n=1 Tax=Corynebacterium mendelii TaxID=2765362 RepID=A0A939E1U7_9CORY|nr:hypothetical protein [Corynebacterium mendelii]MBN9644894.1 hypothetical protein [Corynebacterium mendelii]
MDIFSRLPSAISDRFDRDGARDDKRTSTPDPDAGAGSDSGTHPSDEGLSAFARVSRTVSIAGEVVKDKVTDVLSTGEATPGLWDGAAADRRDKLDDSVQGAIREALGANHRELTDNAGFVGRILINALDKAAGMQSSTVTGYVDWVRAKHPDDTPEQLQKRLTDYFRLIASSSGGAAGLAAAVPGVGLAIGTAAIGAESVLFLEAATLYTLASAYLRGADISDPERRRALILLIVLGSRGTAVVDAFVGDLSADGSTGSATSAVTAISKLAPAKLNELNSRLTRTAGKTIAKKILPASLGKLVPFGIGAVIGWSTSRSLAGKVAEHATSSLGPLPEAFSTPAPDTVPDTPQVVSDLQAKARTTAVTDDADDGTDSNA